MPTHLRSLVPVVGLVWILGAPQDARAQADPSNFLFNSGQTVGPIFEGWWRNPDGSYAAQPANSSTTNGTMVDLMTFPSLQIDLNYSNNKL